MPRAVTKDDSLARRALRELLRTHWPLRIQRLCAWLDVPYVKSEDEKALPEDKDAFNALRSALYRLRREGRVKTNGRGLWWAVKPCSKCGASRVRSPPPPPAFDGIRGLLIALTECLDVLEASHPTDSAREAAIRRGRDCLQHLGEAFSYPAARATSQT